MRSKTQLLTWEVLPMLYGFHLPFNMEVQLAFPGWGHLTPDQGEIFQLLTCTGHPTHNFQSWKCYLHFILLPNWGATPRPHDAQFT